MFSNTWKAMVHHRTLHALTWKNILEANEEVAHEVYHLYTDRGVFLTNVMDHPEAEKPHL